MTNYLPIKDLEFISDSLHELLPLLKNKTFFITGGSGFFGKWLTESLLYLSEKKDLDLKFIFLTRCKIKFIKANPSVIIRNNVNFIEGDLTDFILDDKSVDYVIHAASLPNNKNSKDWPKQHLESSIFGMKNLIDNCKGIDSFLFVSSGAVYLESENIKSVDGFLSFHESRDSFISEKYLYGSCKKTLENMLSIYSKDNNFKAKIARCFSFVGPYLPLNSNYAIGNFIQDALENRDISLNSDGMSVRSYMYMADLVVWLLTILVKGNDSQAYNVGSNDAISIKDLAKRIITITESRSKIKLNYSNSQSSIYLPNINKTIQDLNLSINFSIDNAILKTFNWYKLL